MTNNEDFPSRYDASATEAKWYACWEEAGLFQPSDAPGKPAYTITIPPPNITGSLHMGHALCYPLQDMLGRYRRLRGDSVLVLPGQDHAGIATQSVVDKMLRKEGTSAAAIGREAFQKRVWEWRAESGGTILRQFRALGCAFDWSRERFTLDEGYANAVLKVFVDWARRGLVFRGKRVVNWDPKLRTSVSDIETLRETRRGKLYHVRYPFADGSGEVTIATTRPETMLGDVAVAVHPSDARYEGLVGKMLTLPLVGREIPLIADIYPDPAFGTGAVKITPAHDPNDYQVGVRAGLEMPVILDETARVSLEGPYFGLDRLEARKRIVEDLEAQGFLVKVEDHEIPIVISDRSGEVIEPLLSEQWFLDQPALAGPVIEAVKEGRIKFHPARYEGIFLDWMENIREWCLSRQLWWGHRIPVYYDEAGDWYAAMSWEDAQAQAGEKRIVRQDEDVLDTWFSSGLWPFATLGWPEETEDLERRYPTSVLVTDHNIIKLWVSRMAMMGLDLAGDVPFRDVMIYATVMREDGRRMSKSLGTGIDPMDVIGTVGADALRWALLSGTGENQELRYGERKNEEARNLANKVWNATRFVLMNVSSLPEEPSSLDVVDEWLLSRLVKTEKAVREAYDGYDPQSACAALYRFFWNEVCDWTIEVSKSRLADEARRATPQWVLLTVFDAFFKMLHPVMPFLTEELYSRLPGSEGLLMAQSWPTLPPEFDRPESEATVERAFEATRALRALRAGLDLAAMRPVPLAYYEGELDGGEAIVRSQAWVQELRRGRPEVKAVAASVVGVDLFLPITGDVDVDKLLATIARDLAKAEGDIAKGEAQLSNPQFAERASPAAVEKLNATLEENRAKRARLLERRALFE